MLDRVPYEIFSKIIKLSYKHLSFIAGVFDADETSLPPIAATHVCRSWRTALLSDPTMWTCIRLDFTGRNSGELKEILSRSGSAPLDVLQIGYSSDPSQFVDLINILPHVHIFRNLQMFIPAKHANMVIDGDILFGILHSSPCLRILDILLSYSSSTIVCSIPSNHRIPLPCLQKLSLRGRCGVDNVDFVLGYLDFPVDKVYFNITCDNLYPNISDSTLLLHFLAQRRLSLLSISSNIWADMAIEFFEKMDLGFPTSSSPRPKESSVFRVLYNHYAPLDTLSHLPRKFKMSDITHMCLEIVTSESAVLRSIFPLLDNLQYLHVNHAGWDEDFQGPAPKSYL